MKYLFASASSLAIALAFAGGLSACGSDSASASSESTCTSASTFPSSALSTVTTDSGKLRVAIRSAPYQPLVAGLECIELVVTDPTSGASVDGLTITMTPWMPAMDHGASGTPQMTALGQGRYVFTNVSLFMAGEWELRTKLSATSTEQAESLEDSVEPTFNVD